MKIKQSDLFSGISGDDKSYVFELIPDVFSDNRGSFSEVLKDYGDWNENSEYPLWFSNLNWIRQINRSKSKSGTIRGCHTQRGIFCQSKLVESINRVIYDIITDCRPQSKSFGISGIFKLDPIIQNKLFVPRGFLHSFVVPFDGNDNDAIFNYYCDNVYNKESEICINPKTLIPELIRSLSDKTYKDLRDTVLSDNVIFSDKDCNGINYNEFINDISKSDKLWYL